MATIHQAPAILDPEPTSVVETPQGEESAPASQSGSHDQPSPNDAEEDSAISELQAAFGSILLARKETKKPALPTHKWTGAFELFAFPRELRDRIYYHYLYRPKGIQYQRSTTYSFPFEQSNAFTSLFLTSRQVYDEAFQVFCRYNQIAIAGRNRWRSYDRSGKALNGTLRLFPEKPGTLLQRIRVRYREYSPMYMSRESESYYQKPGDVFIQALRDAYVFKNAFPKMREFTMTWWASTYYFSERENMRFDKRPKESQIQLWLGWMKAWIANANIIPPRWVRFEFSDNWQPNDMQDYANAMNTAYAQLLAEMAPATDERAELEESGRRWLEELAFEEKRKKKGKRKG